ncbi:hypothetical protein DFP72DRAFT_821319 [Ephemerocybe angulata]|uniref:Uncharacterized protein n=2 Tax=Ephemerocybe angulata TaxID=980116 RepID=A0A8H6HIY5_9AGAR|nr:hypothetical protein DFP72DRAFT_821319 [Tulosesus angulatus]
MRLQDLLGLDAEWFPWPDRLTCTLDILMHLPRSVFSKKQLELFLWLLSVNGIHGAPSVASMGEWCSNAQRLYGIDTLCYDGPLGHRYYVNSLSQIIAQEMSNPRVRPHLHFLPEDSGPRLSEARQAKRWLEEIPPELTTQSVRVGQHDFYLFEPTLVRGNQLCIPMRWFTRDDQTFAKCWGLEQVYLDQGAIGWRAVVKENLVYNANDLMMPFPELNQAIVAHPDYWKYIHDPDNADEEQRIRPWSYTHAGENRWRKAAQHAGASRVVAFPIWLYCDDTSGNLSKKWNCHNSWLFTPAGLPRSEAAKEYNVHFLCTSNLAPPLEMLDGIAEQLDDAQRDGIKAWDCEDNKPIIVIPVVLALLGDNPMQSEMASHIGLNGKMFCRVCKVSGDKGRGIPIPDFVPSQATTAATPSQMPVPSAVEREGILAAIVRRLKNFLSAHNPLRTRDETRNTLRSYWADATALGNMKGIEGKQTTTGIKDTFQQHFLNQLFDAPRAPPPGVPKQGALNAVVERLLGTKSVDEMINPVWRLKGLDAHQDTPVEILHVVLLGFVKYFWRDVVKNQVPKTDEAAREILISRLNSVDVSGLGISPLAGGTLVKYGNSLVGRDFRAIAQVAPFVLKGLVSEPCYEAWKALSRLVPLVWQPEIPNIDEHLNQLHYEINQFLIRTARWTPGWFNKPKFHIIVHLPNHIQRFGPAILFATEAFESFNSVIRAKSVHSNRQAPSRDIALAFAQGNRVRHLLSGGFVLKVTRDCFHRDARTKITTTPPTFSQNMNHWKRTGPGAMSLLEYPITSYLGLLPRSTRNPAIPYSATQSSRISPNASSPGDLFWPCSACVLQSDDACTVNSFVLARDLAGTFVGRVLEILQRQNDFSGDPVALLIQRYTRPPMASSYGMPYLEGTPQSCVTRYSDVLCTVNTQHACAELGCSNTGTETIREERHTSTKTRKILVHHYPPDNPWQEVLNMAQMRDARHLQPFGIVSPALVQETELRESANAHYVQKLSKKAASDLKKSMDGILGIKKTRKRRRVAEPAPPTTAHPLRNPVIDALRRT